MTELYKRREEYMEAIKNAIDNRTSRAFPKNVLDQAVAAARMKPSVYQSHRLDLRGKTVLSFGETADSVSECALSLSRDGKNWRLGVHMADVAEYVCESSPLDSEARLRRASLHNDLISSDMLPDLLTRDICNLSTGSDKLAVSVFMDIGSDGRLINVEFEESIIRVAAKCVYNELENIGNAREVSSIHTLREKYSDNLVILLDMYELAAVLSSRRIERNALDCTVFRMNYERNDEGRIIGFSYSPEADPRAMVREIGYFAAQVIGEYMHKNKLPCIYVGQSHIDKTSIDYLSQLVGADCSDKDDGACTAHIADTAKGSEYYDFVCYALRRALPCVSFSDEPIQNIHCGSDKVVSFVRPASRYADLLTQRAIKLCIAAKSNPRNLNINKYRAIMKAACEEANNAERYVYDAVNDYLNRAANEYLEYSNERIFRGFPLIKDESGAYSVLLTCGAYATVPSEYASPVIKIGTPQSFEIIALGTEEQPAIIKPFDPENE